MGKVRPTIIAAAFVFALIASGTAFAADPTPIEQAEIGQLSPALQAEVRTRMATGGQKVSEILDTMLLNSVSKIFASGRVVAADFNKGVVVTEGTNGQMRSFNFDVATLITSRSRHPPADHGAVRSLSYGYVVRGRFPARGPNGHIEPRSNRVRVGIPAAEI